MMPQQRTARIETLIAPETSLIRLSAQDKRRFFELLLNPPQLAPAMKRARRAHAELIESR
jgi:uncharacterized protein (DUF1778 family)